jgi:predicted transcriptional regulator
LSEINETTNDLINLTADIVSAHVSNNSISSTDLPGLIASVHAALAKTAAPAEPEAVRAEPAVSIKSSVKHDYIVCLEDGKKLKMLKRYLRTNYNLSPDEYRAKWNLPRDYPMVAPAYAETRRTLAQKIGLGRKPREVIAKAGEAVAAPAKAVATGKKKLGIVAAKAAAVAHLGTDKPATAKRGRPAKAASAAEQPKG